MVEWAGALYGRMKIHNITCTQLAEKMGLTRQYVSMVMHGTENPKSAELRFTEAVNELIVEKDCQK